MHREELVLLLSLDWWCCSPNSSH